MPTVAYMIPQQGFRPRTNPLGELNRRGLRGLGSGASSSWDTTPTPAEAPSPWYSWLMPDPAPLWSEQSYVPGAVNADPSVNSNPNPTVQGTAKDLAMVWADPLATNPILNATDTGSALTPSGGISALWFIVPASLLGLWAVGKLL